MRKILKYSYIYFTSTVITFALTVGILVNLKLSYSNSYLYIALLIAAVLTVFISKIKVKKWMIYGHIFLFLVSVIACQFYVTKLSF